MGSDRQVDIFRHDETQAAWDKWVWVAGWLGRGVPWTYGEEW